VGFTEGYGRSSRDFYQEHGQPKQLYLRELALGLYDLEQERERTRAPSAKSRCRQMTVSAALALVREGVGS
jgi:hypothetical protein